MHISKTQLLFNVCLIFRTIKANILESNGPRKKFRSSSRISKRTNLLVVWYEATLKVACTLMPKIKKHVIDYNKGPIVPIFYKKLTT